MLTDTRFSPQILLLSLLHSSRRVPRLSDSVDPVEEPAAESEQFSDQASSYADEGEVSDLESSGPDQE